MEQGRIVAVREMPGHHFYPIRPEDIDTSGGFIENTFSKFEVEKTAANLVKFCEQRGGWYQFTLQELEKFYVKIGQDPKLMLFGLMGLWFDDGGLGGWRKSHPCLAIDTNGMFAVTDHFIKRCAGHFRSADRENSTPKSPIIKSPLVQGFFIPPV